MEILGFDIKNIEVHVEKGVVTLKGVVDTNSAIEDCEEAI